MPADLSSFVGRAAELAAIDDAVAAGSCVTLVGPAGCGKTRLAIRAGDRQAGAWPDGLAWVGLQKPRVAWSRTA